MNHDIRRNAGLAYIADDECNRKMFETKSKILHFNNYNHQGFDTIDTQLRDILGKLGKDSVILPPFHCDYGFNIEMGDDSFANYNLVILDVAKVTIGNHVFMAPNVAIYTAGHPVHPMARNAMYEYGKPVTIGDNVWIGGNTVILPGVTIGANSVIGAGSVVTKDVPEWSIAAGNPCKVLRKITDEDKRKLFKNEEIDDEAWEDILRIVGEKNDSKL